MVPGFDTHPYIWVRSWPYSAPVVDDRKACPAVSFYLAGHVLKVYGKAPNVHIPCPPVVPCLNLGSHPLSHATLLIQRCDMAVQVRGFALQI